MYSFQREYTLIPHSPLIHFQYDKDGAALRATEVKPKLDRYIIKHCKEIPDIWRNDQSKNAFNYQMRIISLENNPPIALGYKDEHGNRTNYDIYYGNMGDGPKKKGLKNKQKVIITCFNESLLKYIDKVIGDFFIVTNFGTMQSKGFGSFTVAEKNNDSNYIISVLKTEYTHTNRCYRFNRGREYQDPIRDTTFKKIKTVYSLMKSGINNTNDGRYPTRYRRSILFNYVRNMPVKGKAADMGNEKAWMKQRSISPALNRSGRYVFRKDSYSRYVRALLGISETIRYKNDPDGFVNVSIKESTKSIDRLHSPVLFKVIDDKVYYVATEINQEIYGKQFIFSSKMGRGVLSVPAETELPADFLENFLHYAYAEINLCKANFPDIREIKIEEV